MRGLWVCARGLLLIHGFHLVRSRLSEHVRGSGLSARTSPTLALKRARERSHLQSLVRSDIISLGLLRSFVGPSAAAFVKQTRAKRRVGF